MCTGGKSVHMYGQNALKVSHAAYTGVSFSSILRFQRHT